MKVIFLEDVPPNHRAGDVKDVKRGYWRNYLGPRGLARAATSSVLQEATTLRRAAEERRRKEAMDWQEVARSLAETPVEITMAAGPTGRLYGSVTRQQIADRVSEITGRSIDRKGVRTSYPIRQVGTFTVPVRLFEDIDADVRVVVRTEQDESQPAQAATEDAAVAESEAADAAEEGSGEAASEDGEETT